MTRYIYKTCKLETNVLLYFNHICIFCPFRLRILELNEQKSNRSALPTEIPLLDSLAEIKTKEHERVRTYTHVTSAAGGLIEVRKTGLKSERRKK